MSARQRKMVFMHSDIFHANPNSLYNASRQQAVLSQVRQLRQTAGPPELSVPRPMDMKQTQNAGHRGVVLPAGNSQPSGGGKGEQPETVKLGKDRVELVRAQKDDSSIPRQFWNATAKLAWTDANCERIFKSSQDSTRAGQDAATRKREHLSSEVLGNIRRLEKSTTAPSAEIWAAEMQNVQWTDTQRDPRIPKQRKAEEAAPLSARERLSRHLTASSSSQFSGGAPGALSPRGVRADSKDGPQGGAEGRRRKERNYSDLFGPSPATSPRTCSRIDFHGTTTCSFLDHATEISRRVQERLSGAPAPTEEEVVYRPSSRFEAKAEEAAGVCPRSPRAVQRGQSAEQRRANAQERCYWDSKGNFDATAEVARRQWERWHPDGAKPSAVPPSPRARSNWQLDNNRATQSPRYKFSKQLQGVSG